jgi:hypothetical protein
MQETLEQLSPKGRSLFEALDGKAKLVSFGEVGKESLRSSDGLRQPRLVIETAHAHGNSGSPVLDADTHRLIGLHSSGQADSLITRIVSSARIVDDLAVKLDAGTIPPRFFHSVLRLVAQSEGNAPRS